MNDKIITSTISCLLIGSVFAVALEPGLTYGYVLQWHYPEPSYGYGYGYEEDIQEYGYGTTTTDASDTTSTSTGDTFSDVEHEVVEEVPPATSDQTTEQTNESSEACSVDTPKHLQVRHHKQRVILRWRGSDEICPSTTVIGYILRIQTKRGKMIMKTDTLEQLRYSVKPKRLQKNKTYTFTVRTVLETGEKSDWSKAKRFNVSKF